MMGRGRLAGAARRIVVGLVALIALTSALPVTASADTLRVGKAGRTAFSFVPVDVGSQAGIFKTNGLDLQVSSFGRRCQSATGDGG